MSDGSDIAPWWVAGGAAALWIAREFIGAVLNRKQDKAETDGNVALLSGLTSRIEALEASQLKMGQQLADEVKLRMAAQEEAHRLRLRVLTLEASLRGLGAVIPPETPA
ncbi:hypothetical protein ABE488_00670 [Luteimonas sp. TWI662]|uniref:hypothetical protein n=1 Tax=Luteimonas sp. TWI662 TaxID=3136789 RepID=UPI00320A14DC